MANLIPENKLLELVHEMPARISSVSPDGTLLYANKSFREHYAPGDSLPNGMNIVEIIGKASAKQWTPHVKRVLAGETVNFELESQHTDGSRQTSSVTLIPDRIQCGPVTGYFVIASDITELKNVERALRKREAELRLITDGAPAMISYVDQDERVRFANQRYADWMGVPRETLTGTKLRKIVGNERYEASGPYREKTLAGNEVTFEGMGSGNTPRRPFRATFVPDVSKSGRVRGYFSLFLDITSERRMSDALRESEEGFRNLFDAVPEGILVGNGTEIVFANPAAARIHGAESPDRLIGMKFKDLLHPDHHAENEENRKCVVEQQGSFKTKEFKHLRLDTGEVVYTEDNGHSIIWRGKPAGLIVIRDISERRRMEQTLRENEALLRLIMDNVPALIAYLEPDGRYKYVSRQCQEWFGVPPEDVIGSVVWDFIASRSRGGNMEALRGAIRSEMTRALSGETVQVDNEAFYRNGKRFIRKFIIPDMRGDDKPQGVFSMISDITELKQHEEELRAARDEAEQANRSKSRFLASASHDLRQPLQALSLLSFALSESVVTDEDKQLVKDMRHALTVMDSVLNGLIDISKLDAGVVTPEIHDVPLEAVCDSLRASFAVLASQKGLDLRLMHCDHIVHTDPDLLSRILDNLMSNAIKYTDSGKILVGARRRGDKLRIEIHDTGRGIPTDELNRIFEEFYQLENPARDRNKGLGLGLAIVERTARLLDCPIEVFSREGVGSVFCVTVPLSCEAAAQPGEDVYGLTSSGDLSGAKILLVEDDDTVRTATEKIFRRWGAEVTVAASYEESIGCVSNRDLRPDLVVADFRLDGNHRGTRVIATIRDLLGYRVAGIVITGDISQEPVAEAREADIEILHKPVNPEEMRRLTVSMITRPRR